MLRKIILGLVATAAIAAPLALAAAPANADVVRHQEANSATFKVLQPANYVGQWNEVFTYDFTVAAQSDGEFTGTYHLAGWNRDHDGTVTGRFNAGVDGKLFTADDTVSFVSTGNGNTVALKDAPMDSTLAYASVEPFVSWVIEMKVGPAHFSGTEYKNHGQYVSSQGGGKRRRALAHRDADQGQQDQVAPPHQPAARPASAGRAVAVSRFPTISTTPVQRPGLCTGARVRPLRPHRRPDQLDLVSASTTHSELALPIGSGQYRRDRLEPHLHGTAPWFRCVAGHVARWRRR